MAFSVSLSGPVRHRVSSRKTPRKNKRIAGPHKNASPYSKCLLHGQLNTTCWQISWTPIVKATMEQYIKGWRDFLKSSESMMLLMVDVIMLMLINHGGWILVNNKLFTISQNKRIKLSCTFVWPVRFELALYIWYLGYFWVSNAWHFGQTSDYYDQLQSVFELWTESGEAKNSSCLTNDSITVSSLRCPRYFRFL